VNSQPWRWTLLVALSAAGVVLPQDIMAQAARAEVRTINLAEARRRAAAIAPEAVAARSELDAAGWEKRGALLDLVTPNIVASTNYTRFSDPFFNFGTGEISPSATSASLQASYSLLGAGKFAELKRARASVDQAEAGERAALFRTALATDASYYSVLAERELARVADDRLKRAQEQFGVARVRVQAGDALATDSLQLLLEVNRARLSVLRRDSALGVARLRLGRQVGETGPVDAAPIDSAAPRALPITLAQATEEVRTRGPDIEALRAAEQSAEAILVSERGRYLPELTVSLTAGAYDAEFFPSALKRNQFAVGVSLPLWNGGQREIAVARARAQRNVARAQREDRERAAAEEMAQAYHGYETARAAIALAQTGAVVAAENYRVQGVRYREGATTILDLLEAQVALSEAEAELVQARYATRLALARIEALIGRRLFETQDNPETNR
jgi:outer membrane protein TolC